MKKLILLASLAAASPAYADLYLEEKTTQGGDDASALTMKVYATKDKERIERSDGMTAIFRADKKVMWVLLPDQKMYSESKYDAIAGALLESRKAYEETMKGIDQAIEQMKKMPQVPEDTLEEMKKERAKMEIHVEELKDEDVAGHSCRHVRFTQPEQPTTEVWTVKDIANADDLAQFNVWWWAWGHLDGLGWLKETGLPFRTVTFGSDGKPKQKTEVTKVEEKAIDPSLFELPQGYKNASVQEPPGDDGGK